MSTIEESSFAIAAAESGALDVTPFGVLLAPLGAAPVPVDPEGSDPFGVMATEDVVSAQAVPPPAPTQATAKIASAVRRNPEVRGDRCGAGGQLGGPHWGLEDQWP
jgi:hypothetical protein